MGTVVDVLPNECVRVALSEKSWIYNVETLRRVVRSGKYIFVMHMHTSVYLTAQFGCAEDKMFSVSHDQMDFFFTYGVKQLPREPIYFSMLNLLSYIIQRMDTIIQ